MKRKKSKSENKHEPLTRKDFISQDAYLKYVIAATIKNTNESISKTNAIIRKTNAIIRRIEFNTGFREIDSAVMAATTVLRCLEKENISAKDIYLDIRSTRNQRSLLRRNKYTYLMLYPEFHQLNHN